MSVLTYILLIKKIRGYRGMEKRNIGVCVILSLVTCGIYHLYWIYCIGHDIYTANGEESRAGTDLLLSIVTCGIYLFYMYYMHGKRLNDIRHKYGIPPRDDGILLVILAIFTAGIVSDCILQHTLNEEIHPLLYGHGGHGGPYHHN